MFQECHRLAGVFAAYPASFVPSDPRRDPGPGRVDHLHHHTTVALCDHPATRAPRQLVARLNIEYQSIWGASHAHQMEALQTDEQITPITTIKRHRAAAGRVRHRPRSFEDRGGRSPLITWDLDLYPQPPTNTHSPTLNSEEPDKDFTRLEYNDYVRLTGIPTEAQGYSISGRSPLEWIIDRYHVKTDKASGIVNDPNDFLREQGRPDAVVDLIKRLVTVSMRTQELLATLPTLEIPEVQS